MSADPRLPDLFARAVELEREDREAWLAELRAKDASLAREIEELLASAPAGEERFASPAWERLSEEATQETYSLPERVGPYRVLREIGRGGMGRVFLSEQEDGDSRRTVALKIIDRPGRADENIRRFRDEVRILASLEHPGIARFLDGGQTPEGTWFLALEYVEGEDILAHSRRRRLTTDERIDLFIAALDAVEFAHARGVVHRDLKPGHILVGPDSRPRLLDFGLSKLTDPNAALDATVTRTEMRALTPAYASPEQFRGERATAASDVYSLGVVLYELLADVRPFGGAGVSRKDLERAVLERVPEPPSTAARRTVEDATAPRRAPLGGDLDAICLKALRKEPVKRYATAGAFAADLRRHREGRPIEARRGGRRYRLGRFMRRNRAALGAAALAALALALLLPAFHARWGDGSGAPLRDPSPRPFPFSDDLAPVEALEARFAAEPASVEAGGELALALFGTGRAPEALLVIARLRQIPGEAGHPLIDYVEATVVMRLDEPQRALVLFTQALERAIAAGRGDLVAQIRASRGRLLSTLGRREEATAEMQRARADFEAAGDQESLSRVLNDLAIEDLQRGDLAEGERLLLEALAASRAAGIRSATIAGNLAGLAIVRGRPDLAEPQFREMVEVVRESGDRRRLGESLDGLAGALADLGRPKEAARCREEAIALLRETGDESALALALHAHARAAIADGRLDGIEATAAGLEASAKSTGDKISLALAESLRGDLAAARGEVAASRRHLAAARRFFLDNGGNDEAADLLLRQARLEAAAGNPVEAARLMEGIAALQPSEEGAVRFGAAALLARIDAEAGRTKEARLRLEALGADVERSPSVTRRTSFLSARAAQAAADRRESDARRDLETAISALASAGRISDLFELRLDLAAIIGRRDRDEGFAAAVKVEKEARALGLLGIAARARRLADRGGE